MSLWDYRRNAGDHVVMRCTYAASVRVHDLSYKKRNHLTLKAEIVHEIVIDLLEL
jgi:hypothetical protein